MFSLFACNAGGDKPHLISASEKQAQQHPLFAGAIDQLRSMPMVAYDGGDLRSSQDGFFNEGKPFSGLKVIVQGPAFSNNFLGAPKPCLVNVAAELGDSGKTEKGSASFAQTSPGVYTAIVPVTCHDWGSFEIDVPCLKAGESNYEIIIGPEDGSGPSLTFKHPLVINEKIQTPNFAETERSSATDSAASSSPESAPKTQYELQQQQEQKRQEDAKEQQEAGEDSKKLE